MIDTHCHIYSEEFDSDRDEAIQRARSVRVEKIIMPNIDSESLDRLLRTEELHNDICFSAIGLHPTSVNSNYKHEIEVVQKELLRRKYIAIGEIGIDLYWDKSFLKEQIIVFEKQLDLALSNNLPVIIHVRDAFDEIFSSLEKFRGKGLRGVFHSFTGNALQANHIIEFGGFFLGINGIVTFKNSGLAATLSQVNLQHLIVETDAPYLAPVPHRGKRNEPAYISQVVSKLAEIYQTTTDEIVKITNNNAKRLFNFNKEI